MHSGAVLSSGAAEGVGAGVGFPAIPAMGGADSTATADVWGATLHHIERVRAWFQ